MKNRRNHYRILHVQPDSPPEVVKASYRTLMQKLRAHPDLGGDEWNAALLNQAYAILSDSGKRTQYDAETRLYRRQQEKTVPDDQYPASGKKTARPHQTQQSGNIASIHHCLFCLAPYGNSAGYGYVDNCSICGSPTAPATKMALENSGQRQVSRTAKANAVLFYSQWPQPHPYQGRIVDLSPNGMRIQSASRVSSDSVVKVHCESFDAVAKVVNSYPVNVGGLEAHNYGAEFLTIAFSALAGNFVSAKI